MYCITVKGEVAIFSKSTPWGSKKPIFKGKIPTNGLFWPTKLDNILQKGRHEQCFEKIGRPLRKLEREHFIKHIFVFGHSFSYLSCSSKFLRLNSRVLTNCYFYIQSTQLLIDRMYRVFKKPLKNFSTKRSGARFMARFWILPLWSSELLIFPMQVV